MSVDKRPGSVKQPAARPRGSKGVGDRKLSRDARFGNERADPHDPYPPESTDRRIQDGYGHRGD